VSKPYNMDKVQAALDTLRDAKIPFVLVMPERKAETPEDAKDLNLVTICDAGAEMAATVMLFAMEGNPRMKTHLLTLKSALDEARDKGIGDGGYL
jgi:L-lactate utilization protein LutC